jgi:hypothetical protein
VIGERLARTYFGNENPPGRRIALILRTLSLRNIHGYGSSFNNRSDWRAFAPQDDFGVLRRRLRIAAARVGDADSQLRPISNWRKGSERSGLVGQRLPIRAGRAMLLGYSYPPSAAAAEKISRLSPRLGPRRWLWAATPKTVKHPP